MSLPGLTYLMFGSFESQQEERVEMSLTGLTYLMFGSF